MMSKMQRTVRIMSDLYKQHFLAIDFFVGLFVPILILYLLKRVSNYENLLIWFHINYIAVFGTIIGWVISLFGFVLAGLTILLTCMPSELKLLFKGKKNIEMQLYNTFFDTLKLLGFIAILSIIAILCYE